MRLRIENYKLILLFNLITFYFLTGCDLTSKEDVKGAAEQEILSKEHYDESNVNFMEEVESYKLEANDKVAKNEKKLADFRLKVANDKSIVKAENQKQMDILVEKNEALKRRVNAFVAGDKVNWEAFKHKCSKEMQEIHGDIGNVCGPQ
jgi:hypothetical protein